MRFYLRRASRNHYKANRSLVNGRDGPPVLSHFARPAVAPYSSLARSSLFPFGADGAADFSTANVIKSPWPKHRSRFINPAATARTHQAPSVRANARGPKFSEQL